MSWAGGVKVLCMKISSRMVLAMGVGIAAAALSFALPNLLGQATIPATAAHSQAKTPADSELVLLDTDIGDDIDDAFALSLALKSPEVKLLGITTTYGDTGLRAQLVDRYLEQLVVLVSPLLMAPRRLTRMSLHRLRMPKDSRSTRARQLLNSCSIRSVPILARSPSSASVLSSTCRLQSKKTLPPSKSSSAL